MRSSGDMSVMIAVPDRTHLSPVIELESLPDVEEEPTLAMNPATDRHGVLNREPDLETVIFDEVVTKMLENGNVDIEIVIEAVPAVPIARRGWLGFVQGAQPS